MEKILELLMSDPEAIMPIVKEYIEKYKPTVYALLQEVMELRKDFANNKEYPSTVAKIKKNQFDAYMAEGFTEDQAIAFMINDNLKLMAAIKNSSSRISSVKSK